ncbi:MAG: metal-binding protein [Betaproteobacteria bacterium HGW-Betaproteobacteria-10]|nr:MAG: metal-binding protein [Betaproteobacteria bacterium HGW-Betaproteobacteria-10]
MTYLKLTLRALFLAALLGAGLVSAQSAASIDVYKSPYCGCCGKWVEHMRQAGFVVNTHEVNDVPATRQKLGMPERLGSCHTAKIGNYLIEGHVPASDVKRLLAEKPQAIGLAVPSMPPGSPGMESPHPVAYDTLLVQADGQTSVFAHH